MPAPQILRQSDDGQSVLCISERSLPLISFSFALRLGAAADPHDKQGLSYVMTEHILRGTLRRTRRAFYDKLEGWGSAVYAHVARETAFVSGFCLRRYFRETVALVTEALLQPSLAEEELEALLEECVEELHAERDEDEVVADLFARRALYGDHPLGFMPGGKIQGVESINRDDVARVYQDRVRGSAPVCGFAGDLDLDVAIEAAKPLLDSCGGFDTEKASLPEVQEVEQSRIMLVDRPDRTNTQLRVGQLGLSGSDPDALSVYLSSVAFGGTFTSPLTQEIRDRRGWSYVAYSEYNRRTRFRTPITLSAGPGEGEAIDCLKVMRGMFDDFLSGDVSKTALKAAKTYLLNRYPFTVSKPSEMLLPCILHELIDGKPQRVLDFPHELELLETIKVPAVMRRHFKTGRSQSVLVGSAERLLSQLEEQFPDVEISVHDYRDAL